MNTIGYSNYKIGYGTDATADIIAVNGATEPYENRSDYAAKYCDDLSYGGYNDWFLPTIYEFREMHLNLYMRNYGGGKAKVDLHYHNAYWTSTETSPKHAFVFQMIYGYGLGYIGKHAKLRVRPFRRF